MSLKNLTDEEQDELFARARATCSRQWNMKVTEKIGKGGFSRVFKGVRADGREDAIKICLLATRQEVEKTYLLREVQVQESLRNPNLVALYRFLLTDDFVVMDLELCNMTLTKYVATHGISSVIYATQSGRKDTILHFLDENTLRPIARDSIRGLYYLNQKGYPHRDIKGDNILVCLDGEGKVVSAKLADFGMVKPADDGLHTKLGTSTFMAPEVYFSSAESSYDFRCDMWSFGVTFFKALTAESPYGKADMDKVLRAVNPMVLSLPDRPRGEVKKVRINPFTDCCKHFIMSLLTKNYTQRVDSEQALKHPFLLTGSFVIHELQLMAPDVHVDVLVSRIHDVPSGEVAFENYVRRSSGDILEEYPLNSIWNMRGEDLASRVNLGAAGDFLIISDKGKTFEAKDMIVPENDSLMRVVIVPRKTEIEPIKIDSLIEKSAKTLKSLRSMKIDARTFMEYVKELNCRYALCAAPERVAEFVLPLLNSEKVWKGLSDRLARAQDKLVERVPTFPVVAFRQPVALEWNSPCTPEERNSVEAFHEAIVAAHGSAKREKEAHGPAADYSAVVARARELADEWMNPDIHPVIKSAIGSFNSVLDVIRPHVNIIRRMLDYIAVLESITDDPSAAYSELARISLSCPYIQMSKKAESVALQEQALGAAEVEDSEIAELKRIRAELYKIHEKQKTENDALAAQVKKFRQDAKAAILSYKNDEALLKRALRGGPEKDEDE